MGSVAKIRSLAVDTETAFGAPSGSAYARVTLATDISLSLSHEVHQYSPLREGNIVEDTFQKVTKAGTLLTFRVPIHGFLQDGLAYSGSPANHQLADLFKHVLGASVNEAQAQIVPVSGTINNDYVTSWFLTSDFSGILPGVYAQRCLDNDQQALQASLYFKQGTSGLNSYLASNVKRVDAAGGDSAGAYATSSNIYSANVVYKTPGGSYPNSLSFEVAGHNDDDAYILKGCSGTFSISGEAGGLAWAQFTFQCAEWTIATKSGLSHDTSGVVYPYEHPYALPIPLTHGVVKRSAYAPETGYPASSPVMAVSRFDIRCEPAIGARVSVNSDATNGISSWYRGDFTVGGSVTDYFSDSLRDVFTFEGNTNIHYLSIQIGDQPGKSCCMIFRNILPTRFPDSSDIDGQSGLRLDFVAGYPKTQSIESTSSVLTNADFMIAFF